MEVNINPKKVVDYQDQYATVGIDSTDGETDILNFRTKTGKRGYIVFLGNAVEAGGEAAMTFRVRVNGALAYPYNGSSNQWADPARIDTGLPLKIPVEQNSEIRITGTSTSSTEYDATARCVIAYEDL